MGHIHQPTYYYYQEIQSRSTMHKMLVDAQLQVKSEAFEIQSEPQDIFVDFYLICI